MINYISLKLLVLGIRLNLGSNMIKINELKINNLGGGKVILVILKFYTNK